MNLDNVLENNLSPEATSSFIERIAADHGRKSHRTARLVHLQRLVDNLDIVRTAFIYQMIQNADDASYRCTKDSEKEGSTLAFTLTSGHLFVDTDRDDFTRADVKAICGIGRSTKSNVGPKRYIGRDGIGFKSVFSIAKSVHVQSKRWSFRLNCNNDDLLEMTIPKLEVPRKLPANVITRFDITLDEAGTKQVFKELKILKDNILLFLQSINSLLITVEDVETLGLTSFSRRYDITYSDWPRLGEDMYCLLINSSISTSLKDDLTSDMRYLVIERQCEMSEETRRPDHTTSEVQLAFPISGSPTLWHAKVSSIGGEESVFRFLPLPEEQRRIPFLIQADFDLCEGGLYTVAGPWNQELRSHVVKTFVDAVQHFVMVEELLTGWLDYLPEYISELANETDLWESLHSEVQEALREESIILSRSGKLSKPTQMRSLPPGYICKGQPLFPDLIKHECYLADQYSRPQLQARLRLLGVSTLQWSEFLLRMEAFLETNEGRKRMITSIDAEWHMTFLHFFQALQAALLPLPTQKPRFADLDPHLQVISEEQRIVLTDQLNGTHLIPLNDGRWVRFDSTVYLPMIDGCKIPSDLGYLLLLEEVCVSQWHMYMFSTFGVGKIAPNDVRARIFHVQDDLEMYNAMFDSRSRLQHTTFLYRYYDKLTNEECLSLPIPTRNGNLTRYGLKDVCFQSHGEYDTEHLLEIAALDTSNDPQWDLLLGSLPQMICEALPADISNFLQDQVKWEGWLHDKLSMQSYPQLGGDVADGSISKLLIKVLETDSTVFLGALKAHWSESYCSEVEQCDALREMISDSTVSCKNDGNRRLCKTWFPTQELVSKSKIFLVYDFAPFLELPRKAYSQKDWVFLEKFGVRFHADEAFYGYCEDLVPLNRALTKEERKNSLIKIYRYLGGQEEEVTGSVDTYCEDLGELPDVKTQIDP